MVTYRLHHAEEDIHQPKTGDCSPHEAMLQDCLCCWILQDPPGIKPVCPPRRGQKHHPQHHAENHIHGGEESLQPHRRQRFLLYRRRPRRSLEIRGDQIQAGTNLDATADFQDFNVLMRLATSRKSMFDPYTSMKFVKADFLSPNAS